VTSHAAEYDGSVNFTKSEIDHDRVTAALLFLRFYGSLSLASFMVVDWQVGYECSPCRYMNISSTAALNKRVHLRTQLITIVYGSLRVLIFKEVDFSLWFFERC
jgi:hypothetical protein